MRILCTGLGNPSRQNSRFSEGGLAAERPAFPKPIRTLRVLHILVDRAPNGVGEFGRELWEAQGGLSEADLLRIAREQVAREDAAARRAVHWLICDTTPLTTFGYALHDYQRADSELLALAARPYPATVLCAPDFAFVQDGTRRGKEFRTEQDAWYRTELLRRGIAFVEATGSLADRITKVAAHLRTPRTLRCG